jgi:hypothetical protein
MYCWFFLSQDNEGTEVKGTELKSVSNLLEVDLR